MGSSPFLVLGKNARSCFCSAISSNSYCLNQSTTTDDGEVRLVCEFCEPRDLTLSDSNDQSSKAEHLQFVKEILGVEALEKSKSLLKSQEASPIIADDFLDDEESQESMGPCSTCPPSTSSPSLPNPTWRGRFCIYGEYSCTVLAHMSIESSFKASDITRSLPKLLGLEIVPTINIWPTKFTDMVPSADDIDVYFFPEDYRTERLYDRLVDDIIEHGFAMISRVHDVELLVFSSRELHLDDWRFQRKYYLWGIFRRREDNLPQNQCDNHVFSQHGSISCTWPSCSTTELGAMDMEDGDSPSESARDWERYRRLIPGREVLHHMLLQAQFNGPANEIC